MKKIAFPSTLLSNGPMSVMEGKSSSSIYGGKEYWDVILDEQRERMKQNFEKDYGTKYAKGDVRPAPGAMVLVSSAKDDNKIEQMLEALRLNGLVFFEMKTPVDITHIARTVLIGKDYIAPADIGCQVFINYPPDETNENAMASVRFRVVIMDPRLVGEDGRPLKDKNGNPIQDPCQEYLDSQTNLLRPDKAWEIYADVIQEWLTVAGPFAKSFEQLLKYNAGLWKGKKGPRDLETVKDFITLAILHEMVHALALHLPDVLPDAMPAEQRADLEKITFAKWLDLLNGEKSLKTSVAYSKNLYKALEDVHNRMKKDGRQPDADSPQRVVNMLALEMFCDRFSMFLYENYLKIEIYRAAVKKAGLPFTVDIDFMAEMETERRAGKLQEMPGIKGAAIDFKQLEADLHAAERDHVFVDKFGDPQMTPAEYVFFSRFLNLLKQVDKERTIMHFTLQHTRTSRFMHASIPKFGELLKLVSSMRN